MTNLKTYSISNKERVFIAGKTGSGKTTLAHLLLLPVKRLLLIDSKDGLFNWDTEDYSSSGLARIRNKEPIRMRVVQKEQALIALTEAYNSGDIIIYLDEVTAIIPSVHKFEPIFTDIWSRGRSRNVGAWSTTQRPVSIPKLFLTESEHYFCFRLNSEDDRKIMAGYMGKGVLTPAKDPYGFYYRSIHNEKLIYYPKIKT